ncbi:hypothetical protein ACLRGI_09615 [Paenarthrobacter nitroguajacolicus]|uniref:hypothetical protein n=1 Tax=Paenarthrobacter nitroguajacolicus TaxID=211146 RepID=UPI003ADAA5B4
MTSPSAAQRRPRAGTAALSGCQATFTNDFRRRSHRFRDLMGSLGFTVHARAVTALLSIGQVLLLVVIGYGLLWSPPREGLAQVGVPLESPDIVAIVGAFLAVALLQARRRFKRSHLAWNTVSRTLEVGMRAGLVLLDLGLAGMLVVQNLRWHEPGNILVTFSLLIASVLAVTPMRVSLVRSLTTAVLISGISGIVVVLLEAPWLRAAGELGAAGISQLPIIITGTFLVAALTPVAYKATALPQAMKSRGLLLDLALKAGTIFLLAGTGFAIAQVTPWPWVAPYVSLAVFFLGIVLYRSAFARISSPEALGFSLFLLRLSKRHVKPLVLHSILSACVLVAPLTLTMSGMLLLNRQPLVALLLISLVLLEVSIDALVIQRRTAVLPASHIRKLAQKSKSGIGAALCAGVAVIFSGILGTSSTQSADSPWLALIAAAFVLVAVLLTSLVFTDAPAWLRDLSATDTEDA